MSAPRHNVATYTNDVASGRFLKDPTIIPFTKLPEYLKVTETRDRDRQRVGAGMMIEGPIRNKVRTLHTGLIPTGVERWYVGDHPDVYNGRTCRNTVLFHFSTDNRRLTVFYFTGLEKYSIAERVKFARSFIPWMHMPTTNAPSENDNGGA
ncbi:MAG TPA: hypothetical protein PKE53_05560 [Flavobacteriales bacterium]|nr:hypothetical protein [Flavobacteriales bacterium]